MISEIVLKHALFFVLKASLVKPSVISEEKLPLPSEKGELGLMGLYPSGERISDTAKSGKMFHSTQMCYTMCDNCCPLSWFPLLVN